MAALFAPPKGRHGLRYSACKLTCPVRKTSVFIACMRTKLLECQSPITVSALFKVWICGSLLAGITGWNPAGSIDICLLSVLFVVRDGPIPRLAEFYRMYIYVCVCVIECGQVQ